jgi:hypothetical protein
VAGVGCQGECRCGKLVFQIEKDHLKKKIPGKKNGESSYTVQYSTVPGYGFSLSDYTLTFRIA